jgi:hypothetical protein
MLQVPKYNNLLNVGVVVVVVVAAVVVIIIIIIVIMTNHAPAIHNLTIINR